MKVCGIVAEYNPFHSGHAYHIARTRALLGEDAALVCAMSGNFVQRGGPAVFEKHARAAAAVKNGADLVLELPLPWAMSTAEHFAAGAAALLASAGIVTHLSFGSECGDAAALREIAALLLRPELETALREELKQGRPYAEARQRAAEALAGIPLPQLENPNDILGIEYCKAILRLGLPLTPLAVRREGGGHDAPSPGAGQNPSGLFLRRALERGGDLSPWVPPAACEIFQKEDGVRGGPVLPCALSSPLLSRLRMLPRESFEALPDAGGGLENRLMRASREAPDPDALLECACAKRHTRSRVRRMMWAAALGLRKQDGEGFPPYLRVLAANRRGLGLLRDMHCAAALPVVTKPAAARRLDSRGQRVFHLEAAATDFYVLGFPDPAARRGGQEWTTGPVILTE